jgi:hypothetical protein
MKWIIHGANTDMEMCWSRHSVLCPELNCFHWWKNLWRHQRVRLCATAVYHIK